MTTSAQRLPGVDEKNGAYRVRMYFAGTRYTKESIADLDAANALVIRWRELRRAGLVPEQEPEAETLRQGAEALLNRKRTTVSRKTKRRLRESGIEWWARALSPWIDGELAELPLSFLRRARVEDLILARAVDHPKAARDELDAIKATLRLAGARGQTYDLGILEIERPAVTRRKRRALTVDELELLAAGAPDYARRMILFAGTVGLRIGELFTLERDRVNLAEAWVFIPERLNKEGADKWIDLTAEEVELLREQLGELRLADEGSPTAALPGSPPGCPYVFPTKTGLTWAGRYGDFHRMVWAKAVKRAGLEGLQPHDLRATAATLMRDAGLSREDAAARLGHADAGELLNRIYDQGDRRARMRRALDALAPEGLRAGARPSTSTAAPGSAGRPAVSRTDPAEKTVAAARGSQMGPR